MTTASRWLSTALLLGATLALGACAEKKSEAPAAAPPAKAAASKPAEIAPAKADSAAEAVPVPADFEAEATREITESNYAEELDAIAAELEE